MLTVELKPEMQTKLEQVAGLTGQSIAEIIDQALQNHLDWLAEQQLEAEIEAFERMHPRLKTKYLGQFVVIHQGKVVDVDPTLETLYLRIQERFGERTVLIRQVGETSAEVYDFHGVRLEQTS